MIVRCYGVSITAEGRLSFAVKEGNTTDILEKKSLRYRVNVSQTSTKRSWDYAVSDGGPWELKTIITGQPILTIDPTIVKSSMEAKLLTLSDALVLELESRYPPEISEKKAKGE